MLQQVESIYLYTRSLPAGSCDSLPEPALKHLYIDLYVHVYVAVCARPGQVVRVVRS